MKDESTLTTIGFTLLEQYLYDLCLVWAFENLRLKALDYRRLSELGHRPI